MSELSVDLMAMKNNKPTIFELEGHDIKPCPFCGSSEVCVIDKPNDYDMCWCRCTRCGVEGPFRPDRIGAIKLWQKRHLKQDNTDG